MSLSLTTSCARPPRSGIQFRPRYLWWDAVSKTRSSLQDERMFSHNWFAPNRTTKSSQWKTLIPK